MILRRGDLDADRTDRTGWGYNRKSWTEGLKGGGVSLVMQSLQSTPMAHEAEEYPAMSQSTTDIRIVPLPTGQDVLTDLLRDGARRLLAQAIEAEVAAWIDDHAHLKDDAGTSPGRPQRPPPRADHPDRHRARRGQAAPGP